MPRVLIVDDEQNLRATVARTLRSDRYDCVEARDGVEAVSLLDRGGIDVVLLDLEMPRLGGLAVLDHLQNEQFAPPVIVLTAHASLENAVEAVRRGAYDFIEKPPAAETLLLRLRRALESAQSTGAADPRHDSPPLLGENEAMCALREQIARVGPTSARVLVLGENGTGKELVARAIHDASNRSDNALVRVNCAAIPSELFESELFGHVKGAFTGATTGRRGRFERASGGTLFLDEIGELPRNVQPKLLRALEEGEIERVGSESGTRVDVRVIAATNRDLPALVADGSFRDDLYYRLEVVTLYVPPLRERRDDVPQLAEHLLRMAAHDAGKRPPELAPEALDLLAVQAWPGNVRQLRNVLERIVILVDETVIDRNEMARHLEGSAAAAARPLGLSPETSTGPLAERVAAFERSCVTAALARHAGNVSATARELGFERSSLYKKMRALGMRRD